MKVLIVSQHFWPESMRINSVALSLTRAGAEVEILTGQPNYPEGHIFPGYSAWRWRREIRDGERITRLPIVARGDRSAVRLALNYLSFVGSGILFGPYLLRRFRFDVVFVYATSPILQAIPAIFLARLRRRPVVLWVQDLWPESLIVTGYVRNRHILAAVTVLVRQIYRQCDLILVQSDAMRLEVTAMAGNTPVCVHPNPGDDTNVVPISDSAMGTFTIVFAGNLGTAQALETTIDAAAMVADLPAVTFEFIGSGSRASWLQATIAERGLTNCTMHKRVPPEAMPAIFARAGALLVSLVDDPAMRKTVPSKIQSYLAAGRPIIAALDGEGARVVALSGAGVVTSAGSASELAASIRRVYAMTTAERAAMGEAGRAFYAAEYSPAVLTPRLLAAFGDAIRLHERRNRCGEMV